MNKKPKGVLMCLICERISMIKQGTNPYFIKELETGCVVLGDHQFFKGYTLFLCKEHVSELCYLNHAAKLKFLEEMSIVAEAVQKATSAEKMNYELLGNGDAHMHWHLFPRKADDLGIYGNNQGNGPVWWYPKEKMFSSVNKPNNDEITFLKNSILENLNSLLLQPSF